MKNEPITNNSISGNGAIKNAKYFFGHLLLV